MATLRNGCLVCRGERRSPLQEPQHIIHHIQDNRTQSYPRPLKRADTPRSPAAKGPERALVRRWQGASWVPDISYPALTCRLRWGEPDASSLSRRMSASRLRKRRPGWQAKPTMTAEWHRPHPNKSITGRPLRPLGLPHALGSCDRGEGGALDVKECVRS